MNGKKRTLSDAKISTESDETLLNEPALKQRKTNSNKAIITKSITSKDDTNKKQTKTNLNKPIITKSTTESKNDTSLVLNSHQSI